MGTPTKRTERVLSDAADKVAKAEEAAREYETQLTEAASKKRQLEEENEKLRASILNMALQNASVDLRREHVQLRQTLDSYQTKIDQMREISLLSAKVVDRYVEKNGSVCSEGCFVVVDSICMDVAALFCSLQPH